jgi:uncharacterized protein (TIGR03118 family)
MNKLHRPLALVALIGFSVLFSAPAQAGGYVETDLVVNQQVGAVPTLVDSHGVTHIAKFFDPKLVNPWGIGESSGSPFWISDNGAGVSTLHNTAGTPLALVVSIPAPGDPLGTSGTPTGVVFNIVSGNQNFFKISGVDAMGHAKMAPAIFLFATEDGTILGWNPGVNPAGFDPAKAGTYAIVAVNNSPGAVYKGLAIATDTGGTTRLYAANFRAGTVDVFDTSFQPVLSVGAFSDPHLPRDYAPFNIVPITMNGATRLFVTYAVQNAEKHDDVAGESHGIVDTFHLDGSMPQRFAQHGQLNSPWGVALAPAGFGALGGKLWIGNFGNGHIDAYDPVTGEFIDKVRTSHGQAIVIDGLWSIKFGNGGSGGSLNTLYFTAGTNGEQDGLFGSLDPKYKDVTGMVPNQRARGPAQTPRDTESPPESVTIRRCAARAGSDTGYHPPGRPGDGEPRAARSIPDAA